MPHFAVVVCSHGIKLKGCGIKTQNLVTFILGFIFAWKDKFQGLFQNNQTVVFGNVFSIFGEKATKPRTNDRRPGATWDPSFLLLVNPGFTPDCAPNPSQTCPYLAQTPPWIQKQNRECFQRKIIILGIIYWPLNFTLQYWVASSYH